MTKNGRRPRSDANKYSKLHNKRISCKVSGIKLVSRLSSIVLTFCFLFWIRSLGSIGRLAASWSIWRLGCVHSPGSICRNRLGSICNSSQFGTICRSQLGSICSCWPIRPLQSSPTRTSFTREIFRAHRYRDIDI